MFLKIHIYLTGILLFSLKKKRKKNLVFFPLFSTQNLVLPLIESVSCSNLTFGAWEPYPSIR